MNKPIKIIFIHGNHGAILKEEFWPYIKQELAYFHIPIVAKDFPNAEIGPEKLWIPFLKDELQADENSVLIGHSTGAIAAMRFAETYKIHGSVLIGTYHTDLGEEAEKLGGWFSHPWNWEAIRKNQTFIGQFNSSDDPWIPIEEAKFVYEKLQTDYFEYTDRGHFLAEHGVSMFPELVEYLKEKLDL